MSESVPAKLLQAKCRQLLETHYDTLEFVLNEIEAEVDRERVESDTAFGYAKRTIRKQGIKEGLIKVRQKINSYADGKQQ